VSSRPPKTNAKKRNFHPTDVGTLPKGVAAALVETEARYKPATIPNLKARNVRQRILMKKLHRRDHDILFVVGPAGVGKTYVPSIHAITLLEAGEIDKIIICRPTVKNGEEDYGYLPGTLLEKLTPWLTPILDALEECYTPQQIERMLEDKTIEVAPLAFMRGRTLKNCFVILDEAQNATVDQMKMVLTRPGDNSFFLIAGDTKQTDLTHGQSGLADFLRRHERHRPSVTTAQIDEFVLSADPEPIRERIGVVTFLVEDIVRHPVIGQVLDYYGEGE
jgi:phosphate starvation-inducible PhoH-like protein